MLANKRSTSKNKYVDSSEGVPSSLLYLYALLLQALRVPLSYTATAMGDFEGGPEKLLY